MTKYLIGVGVKMEVESDKQMNEFGEVSEPRFVSQTLEDCELNFKLANGDVINMNVEDGEFYLNGEGKLNVNVAFSFFKESDNDEEELYQLFSTSQIEPFLILDEERMIFNRITVKSFEIDTDCTPWFFDHREEKEYYNVR